MPDNEIYSVNDTVLDSLQRSMSVICPELLPELELLLTSCPVLKAVIRRCVLLLSENLRDRDTHLPLCHIAIAAAVRQTGKERRQRKKHGKKKDVCTPSFNVSFDKANQEALSFTDVLSSQLMRLCAVKVSYREWSWNIEDAFKKHDYLFRYLLLSPDAPETTAYSIKDPRSLRLDIMSYLLSEKVLQRLIDEDAPESVKPEPLRPEQTVTPVFTILSD